MACRVFTSSDSLVACWRAYAILRIQKFNSNIIHLQRNHYSQLVENCNPNIEDGNLYAEKDNTPCDINPIDAYNRNINRERLNNDRQNYNYDYGKRRFSPGIGDPADSGK